MVTVTITPTAGENMYTLLVERERDLRRNKQGTLHRNGPRRSGIEKWVHRTITGSVKFQRTIGNAVVAVVTSPAEADEWRLLNSFTGFLQRHFKEEIRSVLITFDA